MAAVFFVLAAFSFIAYFSTDGAFIGFFIGLVKGLIGQGFYALAPVLFLCAVILTFHRGRPVRFRVICTLLLCIMTGALMHLFTSELMDDLSPGMFPALWRAGAELSAGGAISGALAEVFHWLFGKIGAAVVLVCAALFLLLTAFNRTIAGIVDAIRNRKSVQYIPDPEPEPAAGEPPQKVQKSASTPKWRKAVHVPLDGEAQPAQEYFDPPPKEKFF